MTGKMGLIGWLGSVVFWANMTPVLAGQPAQTVDPAVMQISHKPLIDLDGLVLDVLGKFPGRVWGPLIPGELRTIGDYVPGVLLPSERDFFIQRGVSPKDLGVTTEPTDQDRDLVVMLDAGHGGEQKGARGVSGTLEKNLVLEVGKKVRQLLTQTPGIEVVMTRLQDQDVSLWDRVAWANQIKADLFISIHANAFKRSSLGGVETFFHSIEASDQEAQRVAMEENASAPKESPERGDTLRMILEDMHQAERLRDSSRFAQLVQDRLAQALPFKNLGIMQADFIVLRGTRMPSVLIELGFLTNRVEEKTLKDAKIQEGIALAVQAAVKEYRKMQLQKQGQKTSEVKPSETGDSQPQ